METRLRREKDFHDRSYQERLRAEVGEYYRVARSSRDFYECLLSAYGQGQRVLEVGCGSGSCAFFLARRDAMVTGIDLSEVALGLARERAQAERLPIDFRAMNAERLDFADDSFNLVCGSGILHHLQLDQAFAELVRTLKPDGTAVFLEPLGHNPLINIYRRFTPHLRTRDEHPLLMTDLRTADRHFASVQRHYFHLCSLMAIPFRRLPGTQVLVRCLDAADDFLFRFLPFARRYAWVVVLVLARPRKAIQAPAGA